MKSARVPWYRSRKSLVWGGVAAGAAIAVAAIFALGPNKNAEPEHFSSQPVIK